MNFTVVLILLTLFKNLVMHKMLKNVINIPFPSLKRKKLQSIKKETVVKNGYLIILEYLAYSINRN